LDTGVDDDDHRPPPPPAPDEGTSKRRSESREVGDVDGMVVLQATGQQVTPLANAIASNPIHMVVMATMATKFPPEFQQAVEDQTVMLGMWEELESAPTSGSHRESREDPITTEPPQPGGFHDLLNSEFPVTPDLDTTAMQIWGFLENGARQADAARQEFDKEIHDFWVEREDLHEDMQLLHADRVDPRSIEGMVEDSIASRSQVINTNMLGVVSTLASIRDVQQS